MPDETHHSAQEEQGDITPVPERTSVVQRVWNAITSLSERILAMVRGIGGDMEQSGVTFGGHVESMDDVPPPQVAAAPPAQDQKPPSRNA